MTREKNITAKNKPIATKVDKEEIPVVIEIEEREDIVTPIDKLVADPLLEAQSVVEGADGEEISLDDEELDPFGDKWEG